MNTKTILTILIIVLLAVGLGAGVYLVQETQILDQRAAVQDGIVNINITPTTQSAQVGGYIESTISLTFNNESSMIALSSVIAELIFNYSGNDPNFTTSDGNIQILITPSERWSFPVTDFRAENGTARVRIHGFNTATTGFVPSGLTTQIATVRFQAQQPGTVTLTFDPQKSYVTTKVTNQDILMIPSSSATYTVTGGTQPNPTSTPGPLNPTATPIPGAPTATPIPGTPTATPIPGMPTATPIPGATNPSIIPFAITYPTQNQSISVYQPTFRGTAPTGSTISFSLEPSGLTGSATANAAGEWSWTSTQQLTGGSHTITANLGTQTITRNFTITTATGDTSMPQAGSINHLIILMSLASASILLGSYLHFSPKKL